MGIFFFIIYLIFFRTTKRDARHSDAFGGLTALMFFLAIIGTIFPGALFLMIPIVIFLLHRRNSGRRDRTRRDAEYSQQNFNYQKAYSAEDYAANLNVLPASNKKRRKIVENFNNKYQLCLTEEQITGIVNSSYFSGLWKEEMFAMTIQYESPYQWLSGPLSWLRTYLYVFQVQDVTSDLEEQERICTYSFNTVMTYIETLNGLPLSSAIKKVNEKFFTRFDDATFMIAYRFVEKHGIHHTLPNPDMVNADQDIDELLKKYKTEEGKQ